MDKSQKPSTSRHDEEVSLSPLKKRRRVTLSQTEKQRILNPSGFNVNEQGQHQFSRTVVRVYIMDGYEQLSIVGEGSYGVVLKCRHKKTGRLVAIKKFLETSNQPSVRKMALREIKMLKSLRHPHLVRMVDVFRRKNRFYLVFEYLDKTLLDALEVNPKGLGEVRTRKYIFQILRGLEYCHQNNVIHRDVKPENILVCSSSGILKLCDFGFARKLTGSSEPYTAYVATRWYRAPELLVGDPKYGPEVDIWAVGCLLAEMLTGYPLFPGDSDIDQLSLIVKLLGKLAPRHQQQGISLLPALEMSIMGVGGSNKVLMIDGIPSGLAKELLSMCLRTEPRSRLSSTLLLRHRYFTFDGFAETFGNELNRKLLTENIVNFNSNGASQALKNCKVHVTKMGLNVSYDSPPKAVQTKVTEKPIARHFPIVKSMRLFDTSKDDSRVISSPPIDWNVIMDVKNRHFSNDIDEKTEIDKNLRAKRLRDSNRDETKLRGITRPKRIPKEVHNRSKDLSENDKKLRPVRQIDTIREELRSTDNNISTGVRQKTDDFALPCLSEAKISSKLNKVKSQTAKQNSSEWDKKYGTKMHLPSTTLPHV